MSDASPSAPAASPAPIGGTHHQPKVTPASPTTKDTSEASLNARAAAITAALQGEVDAARDEPDEAPVKAKGKEAPPSAPAPVDERAERLRKIAEQEREKLAAKRAGNVDTAKLAALEKQVADSGPALRRLAELEAQLSDPDGLMQILAAKLTPDQVADYVMKQGTPEYVAEKKALAAMTPLERRLAELEARENQRIEADKQSQQKSQAERAWAEATKVVRGVVDALPADEAPMSRALLSRGEAEYWKIADAQAKAFERDGVKFTADSLVAKVETVLQSFHALTALASAEAAPAAPGKASPKTLTNRDASGRTVLADESSGSTLRQRAAAITRQLRSR